MLGARMRQIGMASMVLGVAFFAIGCESTDNTAELQQENMELRARLSATEMAMGDADAERGRLIERTARLESENSELRNRPAPEPRVIVKEVPTPVAVAPQPVAQQTRPAQGSSSGFEGIQGVSVDQDADGEVTVRLASDILFTAGRADLKSDSKRSLEQVSKVLKTKYADQVVRVEGHTDSDPIVKTRNLWKDNYHLSEARAMSVRDFLQQQGIDRSRLTILGHGADQPVASNKNAAGKAQNRRVEIIVINR